MKTLKFFLVSLFVMLGTTAFAQGVVVHKTDGTTDVIQDVDSVVYETSAIGYYREANDWPEQNSTSGWIKLTSANQTITTGKDVNIAIATINNVKPTLIARSNLFGSVDCTVASAADGGFNKTITIDGKEYYFWISAEILSKDDNPSITIKQ